MMEVSDNTEPNVIIDQIDITDPVVLSELQTPNDSVNSSHETVCK